jgi:ABC-2 type transport system permease protein
MLRFYIAVALTAYRRQLMYQRANIAGLLTNIFFGIVFSYTIIALFHARPVVAGYDVRDTLRYTWAVQAAVMPILTFGWTDLMRTIQSGEFVADLSKPCNFYWYWFSREMGKSAYYLIYRGIPTYAVGALLFGLGIPGSWNTWLVLPFVLVVGIMMGFAFRFLHNMVAFWLLEARAFVTMATVIALFFTGSYIPIPFFPPLMRTAIEWLPFNGFINLPVQVFLGKLDGMALLVFFARQIAWLILMTTGVHWLMGRAFRHVIAQGG